MVETWSVDRLLKLTRRLSRHLSPPEDSDTADLAESVLRLDRVLLDLRRATPPTHALLWIDDVGAALDAVLRSLRRQNPPSPSSTSVTSPSAAPPRQRQRRSERSRRPPPAPSLPALRRLSLAALFSAAPRPVRRASAAPSKTLMTTSRNSTASLSDKLRLSVAKLVTSSTAPSATHQKPETPSRARPIRAATRVVNEWVAAVNAASDDPEADAANSWISLSDALPPLPQQYAACRDPLYHSAREALLKAAAAAADAIPSPTQSPPDVPSYTGSISDETSVLALLGPHGVGKTMLAMELVQDVDLCHSFADGVAWVQLGQDITDEELADQIIRCVETIIAGDFRSTVRYYQSLHAVVARASRLMRQVASLVVIDDVSGPRARRALDIVLSALGPSTVALFTAPLDPDENANEVLSLDTLPIVGKLYVDPLESTSQESYTIFRSWLKVPTTSDGPHRSLKQINEQSTIVSACHGLPLPLAMTAGFLSRFQDAWETLAETLDDSPSAAESVTRIMRLLMSRGGPRFESQLRAVSSLPEGVWVSLSTLADLWEMDYREIKVSARRLGRIAFGEYRLGDSSDDSRLRFHWHIVKFCQDIASSSDIVSANRKMLRNVSRRRITGGKPRLKTDYLPWWAGCVTDTYMCRRLHWHLARAGAMAKLSHMVCDFEWVCQRLEKDGMLGIGHELMLVLAAEEKAGRAEEAAGLERILMALHEVSKLLKYEDLEMSALPTSLSLRLLDCEAKSNSCRSFLTSIHEKAHRPWLKPVPAVDPVVLSFPGCAASTDSLESDAFTYQANCLAASASGKVVCGDKRGNINVYDPVTGKIIVSWTSALVGGHPQGRGVGALATINDDVISGHFNGQLFLRSIRTGHTELIHNSERSHDKITSISATDKGVIAVGSHTGKLFVLKVVEGYGSSTKRIELEGHCDVVTSLHVFPDGRRIASSSCDGFAAIWILRSSRHTRISLNGHKRESGHKENCITTFATLAGGKRLLSACRGGIVSAWNTDNGECLWTHEYGFEFSRSLSLQAYGIEMFASARNDRAKAKQLLKIGYPYMVTRGNGPEDIMIVRAGKGSEVLATIGTEKTISTWLEVWHPSTQRIFVAVSHVDGCLISYELVTSLR